MIHVTVHTLGNDRGMTLYTEQTVKDIVEVMSQSRKNFILVNKTPHILS